MRTIYIYIYIYICIHIHVHEGTYKCVHADGIIYPFYIHVHAYIHVHTSDKILKFGYLFLNDPPMRQGHPKGHTCKTSSG